MPMNAPEIRRQFLDFFVEKAGHTEVESSPVFPHDDPTLLFTNAGMNQFKDVFLGQGTRPYTRAVDTQRCIRAGGKHNDLEDVGRDTYHHTFFEMLGNWSLGDYFNAEAIEWAWEFLTETMGIDGSRLYATYFKGKPEAGLEPDHEARDLWLRYLPESHVLPFGMKDNFWEMGETGPCGPCSELHYDRIGNRDASSLVNQDDPNVLEIWNLVFIQFNRESAEVLKPLPTKHVDTGMGFERLVSVMQDKSSNYDTDLFMPIFAAITSVTGARAYGGDLHDPIDTAYRIIADHVRCLTVALADGATPGADGRGYVLRRILRRAVRHGRQTLGMEAPFLAKIVPAVVESLGEVFPVLREKQSRVEDLIQREEETFRRTLDRGLLLFATAADNAKADGSNTISGEDAFALHDTFGFPIDLTHVMTLEHGLTLDTAGYDALMTAARERSRSGGDDVDCVLTLPPDILSHLATLNVHPTDDSTKNDAKPMTATVRAIWNGSALSEHAHATDRAAVILDRTPFYGEQGGQQGDEGELRVSGGATLAVEETKRCGDFVLHIGRVNRDTLNVGDTVEAIVAHGVRDELRKHHTTTHLLNHALRAVAGPESDQRGSLVAADRLRFDYAATGPLTPAQLADLEARVQASIATNLEVFATDVPLDGAQAIAGVRAVFGERYPDPVRLVSIGASSEQLLADPKNATWEACSIEFCGGTHLTTTGDAEAFVVLSDQGLAAGIRRITALAGTAAKNAQATAAALDDRLRTAAEASDEDAATMLELLAADMDRATISSVARHALSEPLATVRAKAKAHQKATQANTRGAAVEHARTLADAEGDAIIGQFDGADRDGLLAALDTIRSVRPDAAILLLGADHANGKVTIVANVPDDLIARGLKAGEWVKAAAQACGGGGGGRPDSAQAGGKDPSKAGDAEAAARTFADERLGARA